MAVMAGEDPLIVWVPFSILLHVMDLGEVSALSPKTSSFFEPGERKIARWHEDAGRKLYLSFVMLVLELPGEFRWRPYA